LTQKPRVDLLGGDSWTDLSGIDRFCGTAVWRLARGEEGLLSLYLEKLRRSFLELRSRRPFVSSIRIGTRSYYYDLILVCKDGPYVRVRGYIKSRLDWEGESRDGGARAEDTQGRDRPAGLLYGSRGTGWRAR